MMESIPEYQKGLKYSDDVINAVRYGYRYRKEAETNEDVSLHASLNEESEILLWLAGIIIDGIAFETIKIAVKGIANGISKSGKTLDGKIALIFTEEKCLKEFYDDVVEFNEQRMAVTEKQFSYIREEIVADFVGKETKKIFKKKKRLPTVQEYIEIYKNAKAHADALLGNHGLQ